MTLEQTKGTGWAATVHPDDIQRVSQLWSSSLETGEPIEVEYRIKRGADGVYRWFLARAKAMRDPAGRIAKWFGILTEIEDQKHACQQQAEGLSQTRVRDPRSLPALRGGSPMLLVHGA